MSIMVGTLIEEMTSTRAERDRLREALRLIGGNKRESPSYCLDPKAGLARAREIAMKALGETT